MNEKLMTTFLY